MHVNRTLAVFAFTGLAFASVAAVSVTRAMEPSTQPATKPAKPIRLTQPWSKVADLTEDQKSQINSIHVDTVEKVKALEKAEDDQCMTILTEAQRKALSDTLEQEKADKKKPPAKK